MSNKTCQQASKRNPPRQPHSCSWELPALFKPVTLQGEDKHPGEEGGKGGAGDTAGLVRHFTLDVCGWRERTRTRGTGHSYGWVCFSFAAGKAIRNCPKNQKVTRVFCRPLWDAARCSDMDCHQQLDSLLRSPAVLSSAAVAVNSSMSMAMPTLLFLAFPPQEQHDLLSSMGAAQGSHLEPSPCCRAWRHPSWHAMANTLPCATSAAAPAQPGCCKPSRAPSATLHLLLPSSYTASSCSSSPMFRTDKSNSNDALSSRLSIKSSWEALWLTAGARWDTAPLLCCSVWKPPRAADGYPLLGN